jgi:hypothetical protein
LDSGAGSTCQKNDQNNYSLEDPKALIFISTCQ